MSDLRARAEALDTADPLAGMRALFDLDGGTIYLDGNSLGALPRAVAPRIAEVVGAEWGRLRIRGWNEAGWWDAPTRVGDRIAPVIGAGPGQVVVGDSTSVNLFRALVALLRMSAPRSEILLDSATFPTDGYLADSVGRLTGALIRPVAVGDLSTVVSGRTAVVLANHVDYRTGRLWDLPAVTAAAHSRGARVLWDVSHSAGAVPLQLTESGADAAVGCTYKYLNGGPGAPAFLYVRPDLIGEFDQPLPGWCSHADPFAMESAYRPAAGIDRVRGGTPEILSLSALDAALNVWDGASIEQVRHKNLALTEFFTECVAEFTPRLPVLTPAERGSQVSIACPDAESVMAALGERRVVGDFRPPDILRFGFAAPYTRFCDAYDAATRLAEVIA